MKIALVAQHATRMTDGSTAEEGREESRCAN